MKINKKLTAILLTGALMLTPVSVYASYTAEEIAEEIVNDENVDSLLSNPDKVADIIISAKEILDQQQITDGDVAAAIDAAAESLGISISDSEKSTITKIAGKLLDLDIDETELRNSINKIYNYLDKAGIGKEEVKGILGKIINFMMNIIG